MKDQHKPVPVTKCRFEDSGCDSGDDYWKASILYAAAKSQKCKVYRLPMEHINLAMMPFTMHNVYGFVYHMQRAMMTDLKYPVLSGR